MNESIHVSTVAVPTTEFDVGENRSTHACVEQRYMSLDHGIKMCTVTVCRG